MIGAKYCIGCSIERDLKIYWKGGFVGEWELIEKGRGRKVCDGHYSLPILELFIHYKMVGAKCSVGCSVGES